MQIQNVKNTHKEARFKADGIQQASAFVNLSDAQTRMLAYEASYDPKQEQKNKKSMSRAFWAIPVVDSLSAGILKKGTNSSKLLATGKRAGWWALGLSLIGAYGGIKNKLASKSDKTNNFERKNPLASFLLDIGIIWTGFSLGNIGIQKLKPKVKDFAQKMYLKHPEKAAKLSNVLEAANKRLLSVKSWLNDGKFMKTATNKVNTAASVVAEKAPWAKNAGKFALRNSVWFMFGLGLLKMAHQAGKQRNKVEKNYREIKNAQLETAKHLSNVLGVERDVLAQNQKALSYELRRQMDKTDPNVEV